MSNQEQDIIEFIDLINYTLSEEFSKKWSNKYSIKFIEIFKLRLLKSLKEQKPIKINTLYNIYKLNYHYSNEQIINFFNSIDIDLYRPLITGDLKK